MPGPLADLVAGPLDRRPVSRRTRGVVLCAVPGLVVAGAVLAGCSGDVDLDTPRVDAGDRQACEALVEALPDTLADQPTRAVDPADALGAAWGDPAITVTCGVGVPEGFNEFSSCVQADGVGWYVVDDGQGQDISRDVTLTTVGYRPRIAVTVPPAYRPEGAAAAIAELAAPVKATLDLVQPCQ